MSRVTDSIGLKFERDIKKMFPDFLYQNGNGSNLVPDFYDSDFGFWLEAKTGNRGWGVRIKDYQVEGFSDLDEPTVYLLGFHSFDDANRRLSQKTEAGRQRYLDRSFGIVDYALVSDSMIARLWNADHRIPEKTGNPYFMLKPSILNNLFLRRDFHRFGNKVNPEEFYGFDYEDYSFFNGGKWRAIIDNADSDVLDWVEEMRVFGLDAPTRCHRQEVREQLQ
jgi:hypothetical protein